MAMLEVIIGMVFTYMLLSLLGTTFNELLSAWRGWRGVYLEAAIKRLIGHKSNEGVFSRFLDNPLYKQMRQDKVLLRKSQAPTYLSASNFASILFNVLKKKDNVVRKVDDVLAQLPADCELRRVLEQFKDEGNNNLAAFKGRVQAWYDDVMDQSSGWYKRHMQFVTIFVGLGIAIALNADSFQIYSHLSTNAANRQKLSTLAKMVTAGNETLPLPASPASPPSAGQRNWGDSVKKFMESPEFRTAYNTLGLGWSRQELFVSPGAWAQRVLGWMVTALAISLGAPFWFDILKKIVTIRSTGNTSVSSQPQGVVPTSTAK